MGSRWSPDWSGGSSSDSPRDRRGKVSSVYALGFAVVLVAASVTAGVSLPSGTASQTNPSQEAQSLTQGVNTSIQASAKDTGPADLGATASTDAKAADKIPEAVWRNLSSDAQAALSRNLGGYVASVKQKLGRTGEVTRIEPVKGTVEAGTIIQQHKTGEYKRSRTVTTTVTVEKTVQTQKQVEVTKTKTVTKKVKDGYKYTTATSSPGPDWNLWKKNSDTKTVKCRKTSDGWQPSKAACHTTTTETKTAFDKPSGDGWTQSKFVRKMRRKKTTTKTSAKDLSDDGYTRVKDTGEDKKVTTKKTKVSATSPGSGWTKGVHVRTVTKTETKKSYARVTAYTNPAWTNPRWDGCKVTAKGGSSSVSPLVWECWVKKKSTEKVKLYQWTKKTTKKKDIYKWKTTKTVWVELWEWSRTVKESKETATVSVNTYRKQQYTKKQVQKEVTKQKTKTVEKTKEVEKTKTVTKEAAVQAAPFTYEGKTAWTLSSEITDTRDSTLTVSGTALNSSESDALVLTAIDQSGDTWWLKVYNDTDTDAIHVKTSTGIHRTYTADQVHIDFEAGTINGDSVGVTIGAGLDDPYKLRFENGNAAIGAYRIITNGVPEVGTTYDKEEGKPDVAVAESILFSAQFDVTYETDATVYTDRVTVEPTVNLEAPDSPSDEESVYKPDADDDGVPNDQDDCPLKSYNTADGCKKTTNTQPQFKTQNQASTVTQPDSPTFNNAGPQSPILGSWRFGDQSFGGNNNGGPIGGIT